MSHSYDVVVIGAGPAGSRTARDIAKRGFHVALVEEHRRVGVPSHCSGLISPRTLAMGEMGNDIVVNQVRGAYVHVMGGEEVRLAAKETKAVAIDRIRWDEILASQAEEAGAEMVRARFISAERIRDGMRLHCRRDGRDVVLTTRLLVGADGAHSRVARSLGLAKPAESVYALGAEGYLNKLDSEFVHVFVGRQLAPSWFGWIIPIGKGRVRLGIGCDFSQRPIACLQRLKEAYVDMFTGLQVERMYGGTIPVAMTPRSYDKGVMLVGDSAGQVKPFSGGGIYTGLVAAKHCAETAVKALEANDFSIASLGAYESAWRGTLGPELIRGAAIRQLGLALSDEDVNRIVIALRKPGLQEITSNLGDIDYPSRVILRLARALPSIRILCRVAFRRPRAILGLLRAQIH